jgi:uncharacterized protein (TIGR02118 family)
MDGSYPVKVMALIKRNPRLSMQEFVEYYENKHAPLVAQLSPLIAEYRRNYVWPGVGAKLLEDREAACDAITEAWFASEEDFRDYRQEAARPEHRQLIIEDEKNFMDRDATQMFVVKETISPKASAVNSEKL